MAGSRHWGTEREKLQEAATPPVGVLEGAVCKSRGTRPLGVGLKTGLNDSVATGRRKQDGLA